MASESERPLELERFYSRLRAVRAQALPGGVDLPPSTTLRDVLMTDSGRARCRHMYPRAKGDYDKLTYSTVVSGCPRLECPASCLRLLEEVGRIKIFGRWERALGAGVPLPLFRARYVTDVEWATRTGRNDLRDFLARHPERLVIRVREQGFRLFYFDTEDLGEVVLDIGYAVAEAMLDAPAFPAREKRYTAPYFGKRGMGTKTEREGWRFCINLPYYVTRADADRILPTHSLPGDEIRGELLMNEMYLFVTGRRITEDAPSGGFYRRWFADVESVEELHRLELAAEPLGELYQLHVNAYRARKAAEIHAAKEAEKYADVGF
ncbi:MAG: hypothetical protein M3P18_08410 [Actinomycetota bacterium]|nr:hypothetical protein [Actinomycetota bacterium]